MKTMEILKYQHCIKIKSPCSWIVQNKGSGSSKKVIRRCKDLGSIIINSMIQYSKICSRKNSYYQDQENSKRDKELFRFKNHIFDGTKVTIPYIQNNIKVIFII